MQDRGRYRYLEEEAGISRGENRIANSVHSDGSHNHITVGDMGGVEEGGAGREECGRGKAWCEKEREREKEREGGTGMRGGGVRGTERRKIYSHSLSLTRPETAPAIATIFALPPDTVRCVDSSSAPAGARRVLLVER